MGEVTERALYPHIMEELRKAAEKVGIRLSCEQEIGVAGVQEGRVYPDLLCKFDDQRILLQVKIGGSRRLLEDLVKTYPVAKRLGAGLALLLYPERLRSIPAEELGKVFSKIRLPEAHVASEFLATSLYDLTTRDLGIQLLSSYKSFLARRIPAISYSTVAAVCRDAVVELSTAIRRVQRTREYVDMAQAIVGRFDFYKSMLSEMVKREEIMETYLADIAAYLAVIHLLLAHILSIKVTGRSILPAVDNPLAVPRNFLEMLVNNLSSSELIESYPVLEAGLSVFSFLLRIGEKIAGVGEAVGRLCYALHTLRPEHVKEELFGRIYQESLPPETRKNLGAFFTKPEAATLLASLAIRRWDDRVLDPACGSGTLLAEAYRVKWAKALEELRRVNLRKMHETFLKEHIMGIDVMRFAKELSTVNLILLRPEVPVRPRVFQGDGISKMYASAVEACGDPPGAGKILELIERGMREYEELDLRGESFDVVIMNPPFTRRENIPASERSALERMMGRVVRGKTGYWAYFFAAADWVIGPGGRLAAVTPEEFFAGAAAESVRRYLFLGEVYNPRRRGYEKRRGLRGRFRPRFVVKSAAEISFSEQAQYRDYLLVLERVSTTEDPTPTTYVVLKRPLDGLGDKCREISEEILRFSSGDQNRLSTEYFDALKIDVGPLIERHIGNLKPLVGMSSLKAQKLVLELLWRLSGLPTLGEVSTGIRAYNPGQYTTRGVEDYARKLFASRYGSRGKRVFEIVEDAGDVVTFRTAVRVKGRKRGYRTFRCDKRSCIPSLRSPAGVKRFDLTGVEELAIIRPDEIPEDVRVEAKLVSPEALSRAAEDIRRAYEDISSQVLLARRLRITSPNIYWLAFFDERPVLNTAVLVNLKIDGGSDWMKMLTLYLNSSIALLQLLAFCVETMGGWVDLHGDQVWSNVHVPDYRRLSAEQKLAALNLFDEVGRCEEGVRPLFERIACRDELQRRIDKIALDIIGLEDFVPKLDEVYEALEQELATMRLILERSPHLVSKARGERGRGKQTSLNQHI